MAGESFVVYAELEKQIAKMSDAQVGQLFRAMFQYNRGESPDFEDPYVELAFGFVQGSMDRNREKWEEAAQRSRENGKKGGRPPKSKTQKTQRVFEKPRKPVPVPVPVPDPVPVPEREQEACAPTQKATRRTAKKKQASPRSQKVQWAENVTMTNEEHQKLLEAYGAADTALMIEHLSNYKLSKKKHYDDDYRTILSWVVNWLKEQKSKEMQYNRQTMRTSLRPERPPTPEEKAEQSRRIAENQAWMRGFLADWTPMEDDTRGPEGTYTGGKLT